MKNKKILLITIILLLCNNSAGSIVSTNNYFYPINPAGCTGSGSTQVVFSNKCVMTLPPGAAIWC